MNTLILTRGAPGSGKSTFLKKYTPEGISIISPDEIRLLIQSPVQSLNGEQISQKNDGVVWDYVFKLIEERMKNGSTVVVDATNSKTAEMTRYKNLADFYRYRLFVVDFTWIDKEEVIKRNSERKPDFKIVPDQVIQNQYSRFATQKVPSGIQVIRSDDVEAYKSLFDLHMVDFTDLFKNIYVIGDIHGCFDTLKEFMDKYYNDENAYVFVGDLIDRGDKSAEVVCYMMKLAEEKQNVFFLRGNHEAHLWNWAHGITAKSKRFEFVTKCELEEAGIDKKALRKFIRKFSVYKFIKFADKKILITHGGVIKADGKLTVDQMIKGVGLYEEATDVDNAFEDSNSGIIQVHGHRNVTEAPVKVNDHAYNLEGQIEHGGCLRAVKFSDDGSVETIEIKNTHFVDSDLNKVKSNPSVSLLVEKLRSAPKMIKEKVSRLGISSFNFTREAFNRKEWNDFTTKARGLYIDTKRNKIVARAYDKFFNYEENESTSFTSIIKTLKGPIKKFKKYNGFLGLISYYADDFFITTKSDPDGDMAKLLYKNFYELTTKEMRDKLKDYLIKNDVTAVFECIDPVNDPHIIEYAKPDLVLLDFVYNTIEFRTVSYNGLVDFGNDSGFKVKKLMGSFDSANQVMSDVIDWKARADNAVDGQFIEGFVYRDANGFMFKLKLSYYLTWKKLRSITHEVVRKGYSEHTGKLLTPLENEYYAFIKREVEKADHNPVLDSVSIIDWRKKFFSEKAS